MKSSSSRASVRSGDTLRAKNDDQSTIRDASSSPTLDDDDDAGYEMSEEEYATQRDQLLADDDDEQQDEGSDDDDDFVYTGVDATPSGDYHAQLAEALEEESDVHSGDDTASRADEPLAEDPHTDAPRSGSPTLSQDGSLVSSDSRTPFTPARSGHRPSLTPSSSRFSTPSGSSFLLPSISRLRSYTPAQSRQPSSAAVTTLRSNAGDSLTSPSDSHFSAISRASSSAAPSVSASVTSENEGSGGREPFRWTNLHMISNYVFPTASQKASTVLGSSWGDPTVMVANGLICIGTDLGVALVFDFRQQFKVICGSELASKPLGAVTALALSHDHTFLAVGHASGHINIYDLARAQAPARSVPPTKLASVVDGRKEGHLPGSAITQIGFINLRHTAIVSSDEMGLAFYHSLGKVLFVESSDVLRILGKYPDVQDEPTTPTTPTTPTIKRPKTRSRISKPSRSPTAILSMAQLPLGTAPHPMDTYDLVALLTPVKLIVVGLKPTPRTWYRRHRSTDDEAPKSPAARWTGCVTWYPAISLNSDAQDKSKKIESTGPLLAYSWGRNLRILRVREEVVRQRIDDKKIGGGKKKVIEVGQVAFDEVTKWESEEDVLALQWLNLHQVLAITSSHIEVFDTRVNAFVERMLFNSTAITRLSLPTSYMDETRIGHSIRVYKGKLFVLGRDAVRAGTLMTWADRILALVEDGNLLSAIDLAEAYYSGTAPGSQNSLPEDPIARRDVVGRKLRDLMLASANYAFSEERMTDGKTHYDPKGRGVDRTLLFEGLVTSSVKASLALDDYDFLYEQLYERYQSSGILPIFLRQLEPFILKGSLRVVPTYVTQQLIAMHGDRGEYDDAERVIWHTDPLSLDINQAIHLCQRYELYDALIYVYNRTLRDFVSPLVELCRLVRSCRQRVEADGETEDVDVDRLVPNAYKIYPYLSNVLSGSTYPSEEPLPQDLSPRAKKDVYQFLFSGHTTFWPAGPEGTLVLTADENGGYEPPYPYLRLLLRFDSEALLHALDIAFEDSYLNDSTNDISRQVIVNTLVQLLAESDAHHDNLSGADLTFLRIFIARNVPKYPQFIELSPMVLQDLLIGLAEDPDRTTLQDRQLAVEFLLSVYTPHGRDQLLRQFTEAGFYRILRSWYNSDKDWPSLISSFVEDTELAPSILFPSLEDVLQKALNTGEPSNTEAVCASLLNSLPKLLDQSISGTACLLDRRTPNLHSRALDVLGENHFQMQYAYLGSLIQPTSSAEDLLSIGLRPLSKPSTTLDVRLRRRFLHLLCRLYPDAVYRIVQEVPNQYFAPSDVIEEADDAEIYHISVWMADSQGATDVALSKLDSFSHLLFDKLSREDEVADAIARFTALIRMGCQICTNQDKLRTATNPEMHENRWFGLFRLQMQALHMIAHQDHSPEQLADETNHDQVDLLRALIFESFGKFVSQSSSRTRSYPRLFKRLVEANPTQASTPGYYAEFRLILTGMLESYRFEAEFLALSQRMIEQDRFNAVAQNAKMRFSGWRSKDGTCNACGGRRELSSFTIHQSGAVYHTECQQIL